MPGSGSVTVPLPPLAAGGPSLIPPAPPVSPSVALLLGAELISGSALDVSAGGLSVEVTEGTGVVALGVVEGGAVVVGMLVVAPLVVAPLVVPGAVALAVALMLLVLVADDDTTEASLPSLVHAQKPNATSEQQIGPGARETEFDIAMAVAPEDRDPVHLAVVSLTPRAQRTSCAALRARYHPRHQLLAHAETTPAASNSWRQAVTITPHSRTFGALLLADCTRARSDRIITAVFHRGESGTRNPTGGGVQLTSPSRKRTPAQRRSAAATLRCETLLSSAKSAIS